MLFYPGTLHGPPSSHRDRNARQMTMNRAPSYLLYRIRRINQGAKHNKVPDTLHPIQHPGTGLSAFRVHGHTTTILPPNNVIFHYITQAEEDFSAAETVGVHTGRTEGVS